MYLCYSFCYHVSQSIYLAVIDVVFFKGCCSSLLHVREWLSPLGARMLTGTPECFVALVLSQHSRPGTTQSSLCLGINNCPVLLHHVVGLCLFTFLYREFTHR